MKQTSYLFILLSLLNLYTISSASSSAIDAAAKPLSELRNRATNAANSFVRDVAGQRNVALQEEKVEKLEQKLAELRNVNQARDHDKKIAQLEKDIEFEKSQYQILKTNMIKNLQSGGSNSANMVKSFIEDIIDESKRDHQLRLEQEKSKALVNSVAKGVETFFQPGNIAKISIGVGSLIFTYFLAKHGVPLLLKKHPSYMTTSIRAPWERFFKRIPPEKSRIDELQFSHEQNIVIEDIFNDYQRCINAGIEFTNLLFYGPPGTGKTMTARALALELGADYILINSPELSQLPDEEAIQAIKYVVELARKNQNPVLVFFDEADAIFMHRAQAPVKERKLTNEILSLIPNAYEKNVAFIFATNLPDSLDPAFKRRIGRKIYFSLPDAATRTVLFKQYLSSFAQTCHLTIPDSVMTAIPELTIMLTNFSGSDIAELCHEIRLAALKDNLSTLSLDLLNLVIARKKSENAREAATSYEYTSPQK